jgi:glucose/mannose transport system substrate-binding protein
MSGEDKLSRRRYVQIASAVGAAGLAGCSGGSNGGGSDGGSGGDSGSGTATSGDSSSSGTSAALEVLHGWTGGDGKTAINETVSAFEEEYPDMATDFRPIGGGGNENLNAVVAKRLGNNNPPSAFAGWPGKNLVKYEGALGNLDSVWEGGLRDAHVKEAVGLCQQNGHFRAMPIGSHRLNNLFYNVSVVEEAGVDPSSLSSASDLIDAMDAVAENTDAVPMAHAMKGAWTTLQLFGVVMLSTEGYDAYMDFVEGDGNKAAVKSAFQTTKEILTGYINDDASSIGFTSANQKLMNGEAAFIHQGNWAAGAYKNADLTYDEDWGSVPFPGTGDMYTLHIDGFIYTGNNPSPQKAKKWMEFVGGKTAQKTFNQYKGAIPTRTDVSKDAFGPYLSKVMDDFASVSKKPPTLAHGLAVVPEKMTTLKDIITSEFSGPYNVDAAATQFIDTI